MFDAEVGFRLPDAFSADLRRRREALPARFEHFAIAGRERQQIAFEDSVKA